MQNATGRCPDLERLVRHAGLRGHLRGSLHLCTVLALKVEPHARLPGSHLRQVRHTARLLGRLVRPQVHLPLEVVWRDVVPAGTHHKRHRPEAGHPAAAMVRQQALDGRRHRGPLAWNTCGGATSCAAGDAAWRVRRPCPAVLLHSCALAAPAAHRHHRQTTRQPLCRDAWPGPVAYHGGVRSCGAPGATRKPLFSRNSL